MKYRKPKSEFGWELTQSIMIGALVAVALALTNCGQSHNEFKKVVVVAAPPAPVSAPAPVPPGVEEEVVLQGSPVFQRTFVHLDNDAYRMAWQEWSTPRTRGFGRLSGDELETLGDRTQPDAVEYKEKSYRLKATGMKRCVFRNRLVAEGAAERQVIEMGSPIGKQDLLCVEGGALKQVVMDSQVTLVVDALEDRVRWLGTSARKRIPLEGGSWIVKVSDLPAYGQGFGTALSKGVADSFESLINTSYKGVGMPTTCAAQRTAVLQIKFSKQGKPLSGTLVSHTRLVRAPSPQSKDMSIFQRELERPEIDEGALSACESQRRAWTACIRGEVPCSSSIRDALILNFSTLLGKRVAGFQSDRVFTVSRAEANGAKGASSLLMWREVGSEEGVESDANPLSVEDFQEMTDVVEFGVVK